MPKVDISGVTRDQVHYILSMPSLRDVIRSGLEAGLVPRLLVKAGLITVEEYQLEREKAMLTIAAIVAKQVTFNDEHGMGLGHGISEEMLGMAMVDYVAGGVDDDDIAALMPETPTPDSETVQ